MLAMAGAFFVLVEGLASAVIAVYEALQKPTPEASQYDSALGWVGTPNADIPDKYGPGRYVRTNARGFRSNVATEPRVADGKVRVICSGNSFTYGQGVANDQTWCHRLAELGDRFETVNLALPGYGVDQMYLRYLREAADIDHSIHILAFAATDLKRMAFPFHHAYGKPTLKIKPDTGELIPDGIPVSRVGWSLARVTKRADLRSVELGQRVIRRFLGSGIGVDAMIKATGPVAAKTMQAVQAMADERGIVVVFVFLPTQDDLAEDVPWRTWALANFYNGGHEFVDLAPALRDIPAGRAAGFFIRGDGHYTEAGNRWLAEKLHGHLMQISAIHELVAKPAI